MVSSMLSSPYRECILWGEHRVMLYNDEVRCPLLTGAFPIAHFGLPLSISERPVASTLGYSV